MSVEIKSGASADKLTIDPTSKAARVTLYNSLGEEQSEAGELAFYLPVYIRQTTTTGAGTATGTVWAMRNGATKVIELKKFMLTLGFDGTAAAATSRSYSIARFSAAAPTGGTSILANIVKQSTAQTASTIADARYLDTGLTPGAMVFEAPFATIEIPISVTGGVVPFNIDFGDKYPKLLANEGICIYLEQTATAGQTISGMIQWDEV